ncbi:MAG: hypothetical protein KC729_08405 [Candidatus Eisenbacteria bacterium]|uniref:Alginate export domain-containing protein n=1 Tax=Eiseniibacteriota bacterium TaxID=2212470 RepID=A0A956RNM7_UNCEI|nr:hypothetical protein [Candidatus Eisenbacteria bacterium]
MISKRSLGTLGWIGLVVCFGVVPASAQDDNAPSGGAPDNAPRSRLTLRGTYTVDSFAQKNFHLGGGGQVESGGATEADNFWSQNLLLQPRFILADDLNINVKMDVAQGVWGFEHGVVDTAGTPLPGSFYDTGDALTAVDVDWVYLAYHHRGTSTRWYLGLQEFSLGHRLVLDHDAPGLQIYKDLDSFGGTLALGYAKESESGGISDENLTRRLDGRRGPDRRDADLFFVQWQGRSTKFAFNPFYASYQDRSNADGSTLLPNGLPYLDARFRPNVTRATALGVAVASRLGGLRVDLEIDQLKGVDRVPNVDSGPLELLDVNNGDLAGSNLYLRAAYTAGRFEIGGIYAKGSGDDNVTTGEGNLNRLRTDGRFFITEVWEDGLMPDQGVHPDGLGSPDVRGYRELENTKIIQGFLGLRLRHNIQFAGSVSMIRASQLLPTWADANVDGVITVDEIGPGLSDQLGSEFDARIDWDVEQKLSVTLRGGLFLPREAASLLMYGTTQHQEAARELRLTVSVPIPEFSLGG